MHSQNNTSYRYNTTAKSRKIEINNFLFFFLIIFFVWLFYCLISWPSLLLSSHLCISAFVMNCTIRLYSVRVHLPIFFVALLSSSLLSQSIYLFVRVWEGGVVHLWRDHLIVILLLPLCTYMFLDTL